MGFTSVHGPASFWCLCGSDFPFRYRSRSESYPIIRKIQDFHSQQYRTSLHCFTFRFSVIGIVIFNAGIHYVYWNFLDKVELSFTFGWNGYESGSDQVRIQNCKNPSPFFNANIIFLYTLNVTVCSVSAIDGIFFLCREFVVSWQKLLFYLLWDVLALFLGWWRPRIRTGLISPRYGTRTPYGTYLSPTIHGAIPELKSF